MRLTATSPFPCRPNALWRSSCFNSTFHEYLNFSIEQFEVRVKIILLVLVLLVHSDEEWLELLGQERYDVMRCKGTERAYRGNHTYAIGPGNYICAACHNPLFDGNDQYDAGSGFPSFTRAISEKSVYFREDWTLSFKRYEVLCKGCDSHLGHIFKDGPPPRHLRYCINSIALIRD